MELQMQMLLRRLRKKRAFQLLQKIFDQCNQQTNCQTQSWKVQLADAVAVLAILTLPGVVGPSTSVNVLRSMVAPLLSGGAISVLPGPEEATK